MRGAQRRCRWAGQPRSLATLVSGLDARLGDGVPDRAELQRDQVIELVTAVRGGGQAEPAPGWDLLDGVLERRCRDVVAFVGDDQPVPGGELCDVVAAGQGLQGDDVDDPGDLRPAAAELPGLDAEELADAGAPLVGQCLAVDQHQRGGAVGGDDARRRSPSCPDPGGATRTPRSWLASVVSSGLLLGGRGWR